MTMKQRLEYWREQMNKQEASGLDQKTYCRENGISLDLFYHYKCRLKKMERLASEPFGGITQITSISEFVKVETRAGGGEEDISLKLGSGIEFHFQSYPDPSWVADLIREISIRNVDRGSQR